MHPCPLTTVAVLMFALSTGGACAAGETNLWPVWVGQSAPAASPDSGESWQALGPLFFSTPASDQGRATGLRPLYLRRTDARGTYAESTFLYPLYVHRRDDLVNRWTIFNLINYSGPSDPQSNPSLGRTFDVWPIYFSRDTGTPETSYHAVFPLGGSIQSRFGSDRVSWALFPLYLQTERAGVTRTATPWPFIRFSQGDGHHGFAIWPLFGHEEKPGVYRRQFYLWPLIYKNESGLSDAVPTVLEGFLPFYTREKSADVVSENFLWPFFGYTHQQAPVRYDEKRYLWPLLVQGRGDERTVNRWAPFYTHSQRKSVDKIWVMWPLFRHEKWTADGLIQTKRQLFWFIYWSMEQRSIDHPELPAAHKTHLWPLLSVWDNGAGRRQAQFPSPLSLFFPDNENVRQLYTPLFALYRLDQRSPEDVRHSLLWNAISWHRTPEDREFHLGPLFSTRRNADGGRIALGNGIIGLKRRAGSKTWRFFLFDFPSRKDKGVVTSPR